MKFLLTFFLSALTIASLHAAPTKIGIVDMDRIYREYYKTRNNEAELEKDKAAAKVEVDKRLEKFNALRKDFEGKQKALADASAAASARQKAEKEAQSLAAELQTLQRDIQEFANIRQKQIADKLKRMRTDILEDLHKFVAGQSGGSGYDLVFDKSGVSTTGVEVLLFSKDAIDFTDDLLKVVNKDAPADTPPAPTGAKPAAPKAK